MKKTNDLVAGLEKNFFFISYPRLLVLPSETYKTHSFSLSKKKVKDLFSYHCLEANRISEISRISSMFLELYQKEKI